MSKYVVLHDFTDLQDDKKVYRKGKNFPRPANKKVSKARIEELSTNKNRRGFPLIKKIEEEQAD